LCDCVKKDGGARPIITQWISDRYRFLIGKSERKNLFWRKNRKVRILEKLCS